MIEAENLLQRISDRRTDGLLVNDNDAPLTFTLTYDGTLDVVVTLELAATQDNRTPSDLASDVQTAITAALQAAGKKGGTLKGKPRPSRR